jgi:hypothetical protein
LAVKAGDVATPEAFVCTVAVVPLPANVPPAPEAGALKVTLTPETKLPLASFTVAMSGLLKAVLIRVLWPPPDVAVILPGAPAVLVKAKETKAVRPLAEAVTEYAPAVALAVKMGEVATPEVLVSRVAAVPLPANIPLAPEAGALKVTLTPETGLPLVSLTVATNGLLKAWLTCALCPPPEVAVMVEAGPAAFVKTKEADKLLADAVTE